MIKFPRKNIISVYKIVQFISRTLKVDIKFEIKLSIFSMRERDYNSRSELSVSILRPSDNILCEHETGYRD